MRPVNSAIGLVAVACASLGFACSEDKGNSEVTHGGSSGSASSTGATDNGAGSSTSAGATAMGGTASTGGSGLNLGGKLEGSESGGANDGDGSMPELPSEVNVIITADNAYGFGYGTKTALANYFGGVENQLAEDIFDCPVGRGPESYVVPAEDANAGGYLYIIGYADKSTTQGVIAKFYRDGATPVYTGSGEWEVCATGEDYDPGSGGPMLETINDYIVKCNAAELEPDVSSVGWVDTDATANGHLVFGEDNSTTRDTPAPGNEFLEVCEVEPGARWMWFDWEAERVDSSPFLWPGGSENVTKDFLIFRLGADQIPRKPPK